MLLEITLKEQGKKEHRFCCIKKDPGGCKKQVPRAKMSALSDFKSGCYLPPLAFPLCYTCILTGRPKLIALSAINAEMHSKVHKIHKS